MAGLSRRSRRCASAALFVLSSMLLIATAISLRWTVVSRYSDRCSLLISGACIEWVIWPDDWRDRYSASFREGLVHAWFRADEPLVLSWWLELGNYMWGRDYFRLPLWIPLVFLTTLAALLQCNSRPSPGHCANCRYNLTGDVSGICPECGHG